MNAKNIAIGIALLVVIVLGVILFTNSNEGGNNVTPSPVPTASTSTPTSAPTTTPTASSSAQQDVTISVVSLEAAAGGPTFGCGDSIVNLQRQVAVSGQTEVEAALNELFDAGRNISNGQDEEFYNALAQSDLEVDSVDIGDSTVTVDLAGQLMLGGTCDGPRVQQQLTSTIEQNTDVQDIEIMVNGETLEEAVSLQ